LLLGGEGFSPSTVCPSAGPDNFQEEIFNQESAGGSSDPWRQDPGVVLKEVPLGTPVDEARSVMERHRFECSDGQSEGKACLVCKACKATGWMTADVAIVVLYYRGGKITDVSVHTYGDGP
jgi:hypothetical protein